MQSKCTCRFWQLLTWHNLFSLQLMMKPSGFKLKVWCGRSWIIGTVPDPQLLNLTRMTRIRKLNLKELQKNTWSLDTFFFPFYFWCQKEICGVIIKDFSWITIYNWPLSRRSFVKKTVQATFVLQVQGVLTSLGYAKCNVLKHRKVCERSELRLQKDTKKG